MNRTQRLRGAALGGLLLLALALRLALPDWARVRASVGDPWPSTSIFDGHERGYVRAFLGQPPDPGPQAWPVVTGLYRALGFVSHDPRLLVGLSALAGALAVLGVALWTERRFGLAAGLWAGLLVALLPEHLAWSTSAYPVILPQALLVWAFVVRGRVAATLLLVLAIAMRPELALLGLFRGLPGLLAAPSALAWLHLGTPALGSPLTALHLDLSLVAYLGPPALLLGLAALGDRRTWPVAAFALWTHVVAAAFFDQGARHELAGGAALCVLVGVAAARWRGLPGVVAAAWLAGSAHGLAGHWYSRAPLPAQELAGLPEGLPAGCVEVSEEPPIEGQRLPSHVGLWTGEVKADCVVWGETAAHRAWGSRGLADRALRMRWLYRMQSVGVRHDPGGPVLLHRLERRW